MIENPKQRLMELANEILQHENNKINHPKYSFERSAYSHWFNNEHYAWNSYFNLQDLESAKAYFNTCGKIDVVRVSTYNVALFEYGRTHISYAALSDHKNLIEDYAKLNYKVELVLRGKKTITSFKELAADGNTEIYCDTMIRAMAKDYEGLSRNIQIYKQKTAQLKKNQWMEPDFRVFQGILERDKDMVYQAIEELTKPKTHNARNAHDPLYKMLVSQPAIGYAKIAWINGLEIEPTSKLIPKELLPICPNEIYKDDYLKYM